MGEFKEYMFYTGASMDPESTTVLCKYEGETPFFYIWKVGGVQSGVNAVTDVLLLFFRLHIHNITHILQCLVCHSYPPNSRME
jgi:Translationally controlled tumour protein